jgi:iron complex outermembrane receptor protein
MALALPDGGVQAAPQVAERRIDVARKSQERDPVIVVTAQVRADGSHVVPLALTFVPPPELERAHVKSIFELARAAPAFQARMGTITSSVQLNIRGIGAASNTAIEPSVAMFVDGIYLPRGGAAVATFLDIAGAEVLRGPQGTLFGRNASAGALSLFTAQPQPEAGARVGQEAGSGGRFRTDAAINLPLGGDAALRLAGAAQEFGGYWHNRLDGRRYGGKDETAVRGSLRLGGGPVQWLLRADWARASGDGFTALDLDTASISAAQLAHLRTLLAGDLPDTNPADSAVNQVVTARLKDEQWGLSSRLSLALGTSQLVLLSSYRRWRNDQLDGDIAWLPIPLLTRESEFDSRSTSQELQYLSPRRTWLGGRLDLVAGLYFFREDFSIGEQFHLGGQFCNIVLPAANGNRAGCNAWLDMTGGTGATDLRFAQRTTSLAGYGQANVYLTERLSLSLGARWTHDAKSGSYDQRIATPYVAGLRAPEMLMLPAVSGENTSLKLRAQYAPTPRLLAFGVYATGYKSGGYNSGGGNVALSTFDAGGALVSTTRTYRPETVTSWQAGVKMRAAGDRIDASLIFYRMDVHDYQDRAILGTTFILRNSGDVRQQGFELEGGWSPTRRLRLAGSVSYLDSAFLRFPQASGLPGLGGTQDLSGKPARYSPRWSGAASAAWRGELGGSGLSWELSGHVALVSSQYLGSTTDANPQTIEPAYALVGARLALDGPGRRWTAALFGENLGNTHYALANFNQVLDGPLGLRNGVFPGSTAIRKLRGDPRTVGASVVFRFGGMDRE